MKILCICPSVYPEKLSNMVDSFVKNTSDNTILKINNNTHKTITEIFNYEFNKKPDYDFYMMLNDDIIFRTKLWDIFLWNKGKISYGNDNIEGGLKCQFPMIDGDIVRSLGWLQMPTLNKYCGDLVWRFIGEQLNILKYHPSVIIEHLWEGASEVENKEDMKRFAEWLPSSHRDINKIKEILDVRDKKKI